MKNNRNYSKKRSTCSRNNSPSSSTPVSKKKAIPIKGPQEDIHCPNPNCMMNTQFAYKEKKYLVAHMNKYQSCKQFFNRTEFCVGCDIGFASKRGLSLHRSRGGCPFQHLASSTDTRAVQIPIDRSSSLLQFPIQHETFPNLQTTYPSYNMLESAASPKHSTPPDRQHAMAQRAFFTNQTNFFEDDIPASSQHSYAINDYPSNRTAHVKNDISKHRLHRNQCEDPLRSGMMNVETSTNANLSNISNMSEDNYLSHIDRSISFNNKEIDDDDWDEVDHGNNCVDGEEEDEEEEGRSTDDDEEEDDEEEENSDNLEDSDSTISDDSDNNTGDESSTSSLSFAGDDDSSILHEISLCHNYLNMDDESYDSNKEDPISHRINHQKSYSNYTFNNPTHAAKPNNDMPVAQENQDSLGPDCEMMDWGKELSSSREALLDAAFTEHNAAYVELFQILDKPGVPLSTFDSVVKWALKYKHQINHGTTMSRKKTVKIVSSHIHPSKKFRDLSKPVRTKVKLPSGRTAVVPTFDFRYQIVQKLLDERIINPETTLIDLQDPKDNMPRVPASEQDKYGELNQCMWHKNACKYFQCTVDGQILIIALVFFIDGTSIDKLGKQSIEPVTYCLAICNRSVRNQAFSWSTLGYIESISNYTNLQASHRDYDPVDKLKDYHAILDHIFKDVRELQKRGGFYWKFDRDHGYKFGTPHTDSNTKIVTCKIPIQFIICDCKGGDILTGRYGNHSTKVKYLCRDCNVLTKDADNFLHQCTMHTKLEMVRRDSVQSRNKISFHLIDNAFDKLCLGGNPYGIYGSTCPENLHMIRIGKCLYLYEAFMASLSKNQKAVLEYKLQELVKLHYRQSDRSLPSIYAFRKNFKPGVSMTSKEKLARIYVIYLLLMKPEVHQFLSNEELFKKMKKNETGEKKKSTSSKKSTKVDFRVHEWKEIFELTLMLDQMTKLPLFSPTNIDDRHKGPADTNDRQHRSTYYCSTLQEGIIRFMKRYASTARRGKGNDLLITKFHQLLHICFYIRCFGSPLNYDGERPESVQKENTKDHAKATQKNNLDLSYQTAIRKNEKDTCRTWMRYYSMSRNNKNNTLINVPNDKVQAPSLSGSTFLLSFTPTKYQQHHPNTDRLLPQGIPPKSPSDGTFSYTHDSKRTKKIYPNHKIVTEFCKKFFCEFDEFYSPDNICDAEVFKLDHRHPLCIRTEMKKDGFLYRCDPSFRGANEWYDWCYIDWSKDDQCDNDSNSSHGGNSSDACGTPSGAAGSVMKPHHSKEAVARIELFIDLKQENIIDFNHLFPDEDSPFNIPGPGKYALIQSSYSDHEIHQLEVAKTVDKYIFHRTPNHTTSRIAKRFTLEPALRLISIEYISRPAFVVLDGSRCPSTSKECSIWKKTSWHHQNITNRNTTSGFVVYPPNIWGKEFLENKIW